MELPETITEINKQLADLFGIDTASLRPMWRVVFSDDQYEKRLTEYSDKGILLARPEVRLLPKYKQWIQGKYILEHLVAVPEQNIDVLAGNKTSYELLWTFADKNDNYLPPKIEACKFIINTVHAAMHGTHNLKKYHDPENSQEAYLENKRKEVDGLVTELFGDQSSLGGSTKTGESVAYTGPSLIGSERNN